MNKCTAMGLVTHVPLVDTFLSSASGAPRAPPPRPLGLFTAGCIVLISYRPTPKKSVWVAWAVFDWISAAVFIIFFLVIILG